MKLLDSQRPLVQCAGEVAAESLRVAILDGRLAPGRRLKEAEIAEAFKISRTPVREALRTLQREGLVVVTPNRGVAVRRYTARELSEIYELRALLEGLGARRAAGAAGRVQLERLRASCARFSALRREDAPVVELVRENAAFHELVLATAGSEKLLSMVREVMEMPLVYRTYNWYTAAQRIRAERQHEELTDVLATGDADRAEALMRCHILDGGAVLVAHVDELASEQEGYERSF